MGICIIHNCIIEGKCLYCESRKRINENIIKFEWRNGVQKLRKSINNAIIKNDIY